MASPIFPLTAFFLVYFINTSAGQNGKTDTIFLVKESHEGLTHQVFIDENKKSQFYNKITDFRFGLFDQESYNNSIKFFIENKIGLTKTKVMGMPTKWVTLKQFKGKFYSYHPCDFLYHYQVGINDTTFIDYTGEGPIANKIVSFKKVDDKTFSFLLTGIYDQTRNLTIHLIDKKNGIAVFEESKDSEKSYYLMISAGSIRNLPIIVNACHMKYSEIEFEESDYKALLNRK